MLRFVSSAEYADSRARHRVPTAPVEQVRMLTDSADGDACKRLHVLVHQRTDGSTLRYVPTFFTAGGYYYVPLVKEPKPHPRGYMDTSMVPLLVIDRHFQIIASVGM